MNWPADTITSLDELADPADQVLYVEKPGGGYELAPAARKRLDPLKAAHAARQAERDAINAEIARLTAQTDKYEKALHRLVAGKAIRNAARKVGCAPRFLGAVEATLLGELNITIEDDAEGQPVALLAEGGSIEFAVAAYLGDDEGQAFLEPVKTVGTFTAAIRGLQ